MTPVYQTKHGPPDGNCFAACVASLLDRNIEDVDVDVASCERDLRTLLKKVEQKANCTICYVTYRAIAHGIVTTSERYCFAEVCTCVFNGDPYHDESTWHVVVCEIAENGKISLLFNPDKTDLRQNSLDEFPAVERVFFVKASSNI